MKAVIVSLLMSCHLFCCGQNVLFKDSEETKFGLSIRGKALAGQILEDWLHMNLTFGVESRFMNYHSFGVDFVYFRNRMEEESLDTVTNEYHDNGWSDFDKRKYLLVDYRFYFKFIPKINHRVVPYINLLTKQGVRSMWYQKGSIFNRKHPLYHQSRFQEYGVALGCRISFPDSNVWGLDVSAGALRNFVQLDYQNDQYKGKYGGDINAINNPWKFHFRLNLFVNLFAKRQ